MVPILHTSALFDIPVTEPTRSARRRKFPEKKYKRRVSRDFERSNLAVSNAIYEGTSRPAWAAEWLRAVWRNDDIQAMNRQGRENVRLLTLIMARSVDHASMTIRPGWDYLIEASGLSKSTVNRIRQRLHDAKLLGTVAKGRTAACTPQKTINERAVYVLLVPSPLRLVEKSETPTANFVEIPPRTREGASIPDDQTDTATPRRSFQDSPQGLVSVSQPAHRKGDLWPGNATTSAQTKAARRANERQAASELQARFFELRRTTTADIASRCRPFFMAGWTLNDIAHALDWMPGGGQWAHDGAKGISDVGRWMAYRLKAWMREGTVIASHSQRVVAEAKRQKAISRKALERHAAELANRPAQDMTNRRGATLAKAVLRGDATINPETGEVSWK